MRDYCSLPDLRESCVRVRVVAGCWAAAICLGCAAVPSARGQARLTLWYRQPAAKWVEALPIGNGRIGAMVFGDTRRERIQLNENSLWDGHRQDTTNPDALKYLPEVRRLLFAGRNAEATALAESRLMGKPVRIKSYQTLGDLRLELPGESTAADYRRELDLDTAVTRVTYRQDGALFTREAFASVPDQCIVVHLTCDRRRSISVTARLNREQDAAVLPAGADGLKMTGQIMEKLADGSRRPGMRFAALLRAVASGGRVESADSSALSIRGADSVTLFITAATDYRGLDPEAEVTRQMESAVRKPFARLKSAHVAEHQRLFRRADLRLESPNGADISTMPTDERLAAVKRGADDPGLAALYFQFGRYLLISSSRKGGLPANLQGLWNEHLEAPWNSDYHTNINLQMNYWPAEVTNLGECHEPLIAYTESLTPSGRRTAKVHYGCRGFVVHHLSDVWGFTTPADGVWGIWPMGGAWLCRHAWERYAYSGDREFLARRGYPLMKEGALFLLDYLVPDPKGRLVTNPSHSPENSFFLPDGKTSMFTYGATMDLEIIHDLFTRCIEASRILNRDADFRAKLESALSRLAPLQISRKSGRLQEWIEDYGEPEPGHRHISHMYAVYPGDQISLSSTPELATAARKSLEYRLANGGGHTGWSRAWIVCLWARFRNAEKAHENLQALLARSTLPNLFDNHPPFQIDGNFGGCAGIAEMLLQSHEGAIDLLPAVPESWRTGEYHGLRARGGYEVSAQWRDGRLEHAKVKAKSSGICRIRWPRAQTLAQVTESGNAVAAQVVGEGGQASFAVRSGRTYRLQFR